MSLRNIEFHTFYSCPVTYKSVLDFVFELSEEVSSSDKGSGGACANFSCLEVRPHGMKRCSINQ